VSGAVSLPGWAVSIFAAAFMAMAGFTANSVLSNSDAIAQEVAREQVDRFTARHEEEKRQYDKIHEGKPHAPTEKRLTENAVKIAEVNGRVGLVEKDILYIKDGIKDIKQLILEMKK